jgi:hypothetical protein
MRHIIKNFNAYGLLLKNYITKMTYILLYTLLSSAHKCLRSFEVLLQPFHAHILIASSSSADSLENVIMDG